MDSIPKLWRVCLVSSIDATPNNPGPVVSSGVCLTKPSTIINLLNPPFVNHSNTVFAKDTSCSEGKGTFCNN